ncbi:hypothetical protein ABVT39_004681 [Epinephelus coioides]
MFLRGHRPKKMLQMDEKGKERLEKDEGKSKENRLGDVGEPGSDGKRLLEKAAEQEWAEIRGKEDKE